MLINMKRKGYMLLVFLVTLFVTESNITAQEALEITVQADKPGAEIQSSMWGVFFEDEFANGEVTTKWGGLRAQMGHAPLLAHVDEWQWRPDLIWFDNLTTIGTPNYYVQKFFSNYKRTAVVPVLSNGKSLTGQDGVFASSSIEMKTEKLYVKVVNSTNQIKPVAITLGPLPYLNIALKETLKSGSKDDFNSISNPKLIYPASKPVKVAGRKINAEAEPLSVSVFIIDFKTR
jgi:hypothetical protein